MKAVHIHELLQKGKNKRDTIENKENEHQNLPRSYDIYVLSRKERSLFYLVTGFSLAGVAYLFYQNLILSLMTALISLYLEKYYCKHLANKRKRNLNYQFRDALYSISASVATGRQMPEAMDEARENMMLIYGEEADITRELTQIVHCVYESRESEEEVLRDFADRSSLEDVRQFVDVYFTCRATGGDMEKVVMKTVNMIVDKISIEKDITVLTAQKRFEAKILTTIPFVVVFFLQVTSPDYFQIMYESFFGKCIMTLALGAVALAYSLSMKITDIKI